MVRKNIIPGNSGSLWSAVNVSKDLGTNEIPSNMYYKDRRVPKREVADCFAAYFEEKVAKLVDSATVNPNVYNGKKSW